MRRVLIVMHREDCLGYAIQKALEREYEVSAANDADVAADMLKLRPDALLVDLFLPGVDGLTFLKQNREALPPTIVALTVYFDDDILNILAELGVGRVIMKPCTVAEVMKKLRESLNSLPYA